MGGKREERKPWNDGEKSREERGQMIWYPWKRINKRKKITRKKQKKKEQLKKQKEKTEKKNSKNKKKDKKSIKKRNS